MHFGTLRLVLIKTDLSYNEMENFELDVLIDFIGNIAFYFWQIKIVKRVSKEV